MLAERLDGIRKLAVREGQDGAALLPGTVWLAPGDHHMRIEQRDGRPLLQSVGDCYGADVLTVILTGMGRDGQLGCRQLYALGATVYVQDEASSVVWGMPGAVAQAGLAQRILPLADIGPAIVARLGSTTLEAGRHVG